MNRHALLSSLFLACMMSAGSALAGTEIVKCIDAGGHVVLTDQPCPVGNELALAPAPAAAPAERRRDPWIKKAAGIAPMTRDAMTLKAARASMQMLDNASSMLRQQRIAALN